MAASLAKTGKSPTEVPLTATVIVAKSAHTRKRNGEMACTAVSTLEVEVHGPGSRLSLCIIPVLTWFTFPDSIGQVGGVMIKQPILTGQISQFEFICFAVSFADLPEKMLIVGGVQVNFPRFSCSPLTTTLSFSYWSVIAFSLPPVE